VITAMLIVVPLLLITLLGARFLTISLRRQRLKEVNDRLSGQQILLLDSCANLMGQESGSNRC